MSNKIKTYFYRPFKDKNYSHPELTDEQMQTGVIVLCKALASVANKNPDIHKESDKENV